ncbi:glycoside hydrolase superfamily [Pilobolus umbonatus]|nr:glycoside hydrolase superfamily [Pilobolus umbonatus]
MFRLTLIYFVFFSIGIQLSWAVQDNLIWPIPQIMTTGQLIVNVDPSFYINAPHNKYIQKAVDRYNRIISNERWVPVQKSYNQSKTQQKVSKIMLESLHVMIDDANIKLEHGVDESYLINIPSNSTEATLKSKTLWGALHGLETFSQLIQSYHYHDEGTGKPNHSKGYEHMYIPNTPIFIEDSPKYQHRGLMLDTSRNYFPVFHWHITDSHSFPLRLKTLPELAMKGAYKLHGRRLIYTKKDVRRIVKYGYERGVRIIPEIDMPAHTGSWALAHKDITTCTGIHYKDETNSWNNRFASEPGTGQLNPIKSKTYHIISKVIHEVTTLFPDNFFHGGGDEPVYNCWNKDDDIKEFMAKNNVTGIDLLNNFLQKELDYIHESKKTAILWEDSVTNIDLPISKNVILQVWTNPVRDAIRKGYKVIASNYNFWYLDCGHGGWEGNNTSYDEQTPPTIPESISKELEENDLTDNYSSQNWGGSGGDWCSPFKTWQRIYSYDLAYNLTQSEAENVLGGEVALWTEQTDSTALDVRLWPRTAAAAEILWSDRYDINGNKRDIGDAMKRIFDWRYRLLGRGINAEALQPLWW